MIVKPKEPVSFKDGLSSSKLYDPLKKFSRLAKKYKAKSESAKAN